MSIMAKYNITEKKRREATYCTLVKPALMDELEEKIYDLVVVKKKYKDKNYTARRLANDLCTNTRYVSAVVNVRFGMNYTSFINKYRIQEAVALLTSKRQERLRMEDISDMVGFANRQSFYAAFYRFIGIKPKEYKAQHASK